jgi:exopolyphosphatase / guanosine-5'-triphosphate,3'-diphosphate pyrophosphatase
MAALLRIIAARNVDNPDAMPLVAVIDIGSNSIKILVAARASDGGIETLHLRTIDARISTGIGSRHPGLSEDGMARGLDAIVSLLDDAARFSPARIVLAATSAVRDATNGADFQERVRAVTGQEIRILTGAEEAGLVGRGVTCDPALRQQRDFYVFDLGGGSLECLAFRQRQIEQAVSLPLGCVRLAERLVLDPGAPFPDEAAAAVAVHARESIARSTFRFALPPGSIAVGSGGTMATVRAILGARAGKTFEQTSATIAIAQLRELLAWLGALPLAGRRSVPGLPAGRADVFPTALATFIALAETGAFTAYQNSVFTLRCGIADETLAEMASA